MKQRLTQGWSARRVLYLLIGLAIAIQAGMVREWFGVAAGGYFAVMGLFGFGCAGGNCGFTPGQQAPAAKDDISFEEVA